MTALTDPDITSSDRLAHQLTVAVDACIGVIAIRCEPTEVYRIVDELFSLAMQHQLPFMLHSSETGWQHFQSIDPADSRATFNPMEPTSGDTTTADIGKAFAKLYDAKEGTSYPTDGFFCMLDLHHTFTEMKTQTRIRKQANLALSNGQRLFLIVPKSFDIPEEIAPLMHMIDFGYPNREELGEIFEDSFAAFEDSNRPEFTEEEVNAILSNGQGMTAHAFETALATSITGYNAEHETLEGFGAEAVLESLRNSKTMLLQNTNVLELQRPVSMDEIGGLEAFKDWMQTRKATFKRDNITKYNVTPSRGALVVGPPGCGKSLVAKAAGSALDLPVIRFDIGRVFNSYIGQSENAMRGVLTLLDAMAPLVLMVDEIDKGFSGMSGGANDGGTTSRVFGTFLTWMQERDQVGRPIFQIMTANRIGGLPPELTRKGRIDEIWSVSSPNDAERKSILEIHLGKRGAEFNESDMAAAVRITDGLVGAEIESVVEDALVRSLGKKKPGITFEMLEEARADVNEIAKTRANEFREMADWARDNARPATAKGKATVTRAKPIRRKGGRVKTTVRRT